MKHLKLRVLFCLAVLASVLFSSGCVHVDVTIALHEKDPGATITERIRLTRKLRELCPSAEEKQKIEAHLTRDAALERLKSMGKGMTLTSHKVYELPDGSRESLSVYSIPNASDVRFPNPYPGSSPAGLYTINLSPSVGRTGKEFGQMALVVTSADRKKHSMGSGVVKKAPTPLARQRYRLLKPVMADLLSDLNIAFRVTVPTRFTGGRIRGIRGGVKQMTLVSISGKNLDRSGRAFFDNEEVMISLLQMDLRAGVVFGNSGGSRSPRLRSGRGYHANYFRFIPTEYYKNKYFTEKTKK